MPKLGVPVASCTRNVLEAFILDMVTSETHDLLY